ncbi:hypothetical protein ACLOJK_022158 [Asimina triloba]
MRRPRWWNNKLMNLLLLDLGEQRGSSLMKEENKHENRLRELLQGMPRQESLDLHKKQGLRKLLFPGTKLPPKEMTDASTSDSYHQQKDELSFLKNFTKRNLKKGPTDSTSYDMIGESTLLRMKYMRIEGGMWLREDALPDSVIVICKDPKSGKKTKVVVKKVTKFGGSQGGEPSKIVEQEAIDEENRENYGRDHFTLAQPQPQSPQPQNEPSIDPHNDSPDIPSDPKSSSATQTGSKRKASFSPIQEELDSPFQLMLKAMNSKYRGKSKKVVTTPKSWPDPLRRKFSLRPKKPKLPSGTKLDLVSEKEFEEDDLLDPIRDTVAPSDEELGGTEDETSADED